MNSSILDPEIMQSPIKFTFLFGFIHFCGTDLVKFWFFVKNHFPPEAIYFDFDLKKNKIKKCR